MPKEDREENGCPCNCLKLEKWVNVVPLAGKADWDDPLLSFR